jgi:hypothetical protein
VGIPFVLQLEVKQMNSLAPTYCALTTTQVRSQGFTGVTHHFMSPPRPTAF